MQKIILPSIENNPSITFCRDVRDICNPLFKNTDINYLCYCRYFPNKSYIALSSNPEWVKHFYYNQYPSAGYQGKALQSGIYFSQNIDHMGCTQSMIEDMRSNFKLYNIFVFLNLNKEYCDMVIYCMKKVTYDPINFYLRNLDLLENFNHYFKEKADKLIIQSSMNRIFIPEPFEKTFSIKKMSFSDKDPHALRELQNSFKHSKSHHYNPLYDCMNMQLTNQEIKCIELMMRGKTSKMIGKELNISHRTVETHVQNIKRKLNVQSKPELIDFIFEQILLSKKPLSYRS
jgi:DNA-binding CsgD family transcriptional regulator